MSTDKVSFSMASILGEAILDCNKQPVMDGRMNHTNLSYEDSEPTMAAEDRGENSNSPSNSPASLTSSRSSGMVFNDTISLFHTIMAIQGHCLFHVTSYELQVASYELQVTSYTPISGA